MEIQKRLNLCMRMMHRSDADTDHQPTIFFSDQTFTKDDIRLKIENFACFLREKNIHPEDRVILMLNDTPVFVVAFLGAIAMGAVPVPINPKLSEAALAHILEDSRARSIIMEGAEWARVHNCLSQSKYLCQDTVFVQDVFTAVPALDRSCSIKTIWYKQTPAHGFEYYIKKKESVAFWQYTSGTTGMPKAVMHSQEVMLHSIRTFAQQTLQITSADTILSIPKMFFGYGLGNSLFFSLGCGASVILDENWFTVEGLKTKLKAFSPTVFFAVPKVYSILLHHIDEFKSLLGSVRLCYSAGSHLPKELNELWKQHFGYYILDGIGSTEIGHVFISNTSAAAQTGSIGYPVEGYEIKVREHNQYEIKQGVAGELLVRPRYALMGYWENPEANRQKYTDGWYRTGDLVVQHANGSYSYVGRADDLFKVNGRWLVPAELEKLVVEHLSVVEECAVVGVPDAEGHLEPVMCLVTRFDDESLETHIAELLRAKVESYKLPARYIQVREFPKNENGKVVRSRLVSEAQHMLAKIRSTQ